MIVPGSANALLLAQGAAPSGYNLTKSLRFRNSAAASLSRTPASTTNQKTWTYSVWIKRSISNGALLDTNGGVAGTPRQSIYFDTNNLVFELNSTGSAWDGTLITSQVFRDPSAWYHIVLAYDSTQATASNRIKLYVNGTQVTAFGTATYPSQNTNSPINTTYLSYIGRINNNSGYYYDGYMTEVNFIDGQALTPSSFGENNTTTGVWQPKRYTGTYGTNGFYLPFTDVATTSGSNAGLGKDFSGNGNYWNTNNISVTAGSTYDSMTDVPTLTSATAANYCVLNPLNTSSTHPVSDGNLTVTFNSASSTTTFSSFGVSSGKWYWEATVTTTDSGNIYWPAFGVNTNPLATPSQQSGDDAYGFMYLKTGEKFNSSNITSYGSSFTTGDVIGVALDMTAGTITFYKNNTSQGQAFSGITGTAFPVVTGAKGTSNFVISTNFGQQPFAYTPPTGYVALNTYNLPTSTIVAGNKVMDATTYTGDGTNGKAITNAGGFKPDLVWVKARSSAIDNWLTNSVVGTSKQLSSNLTDAEATYNLLSSFNSNGFGVNGGTYTGTNQNGTTYVGWQWQAGQGTTSSNTSGSITSTVSVNASAGFSVVTYTNPASGSSWTVGHGLGVAPAMIITKQRSATSGWAVYHKSLGATNAVFLQSTGASASSTIFNNTAPTSTVMSFAGLGSNYDASATMVAYCWSEIAGFSKFGSYTGNGSTDGTFVYTGFRPKFVLIKNTSSGTTNDWQLLDTTRDPSNVGSHRLYPNLSQAEDDVAQTDILSNGFKPRITGASVNGSGNVYIYAAFAENPFKNALAR